MAFEMSKLRKEDLSLYLYVKDIVLKDFIEEEVDIPLIYSEELSAPYNNSYVYYVDTDMLPKPTSNGRGWVYFDETGLQCLRNTNTISGTPEQSNRIAVYGTTSSGYGLISDNEYMIDYVDGRVVTSGTVTPEYIDYTWNYVSVVDEWEALAAADSPIVVVDTNTTDRKGYQLGGGKKDIRSVDIHIFASSAAERNDLSERIHNSLYEKSIPIYSFPNGSVLDSDGTFYGRKRNHNKNETLFSRATVSGVSNLYFEDVISRNINLPLILKGSSSDVSSTNLNSYRAKVSFSMFSYNNTVGVN